MKDESKTKKQLITELKKLRLENNRIKKSGNVIDEIVRERLENEKKFRQLYETMPVAYQSLDRNGKILDVNKIWCKALGFNREEVIGKHFAEFLTDESKKKFKIAFRDFRKKGTKPDTDYEMRNKDGEIIIISYTGRAAYDKSGTFIQTHCLLEDITEKKRTEIKLKKDLEQQKVLSQVTHLLTDLKNFDSNLNKALQLIGEHHNVSRVYIFEDTEDGKFTNNTFEWCNVGIEPQIDELQDFPYSILPSWKKILKKKGMILSQNIYKLPRDITFILEPQGIKAILVLPIFVSDKMYGFIGFDECIKHREWEENDVEFLRTIVNVISNSFERKLMEKAVLESEERFRGIIENTTIGFYRSTKDGKILMANPALVKMLGYSNFKELQKLNVSNEGYYNKQTRIEFIKEIEKKGYLIGFESEWKKRDGTVLYISENARVVKDEDNNIIYYEGSVQDITERKRAEEAKSESEERYHQLVELSPDAIMIHQNGKFVFVNQAAIDMFNAKSRNDFIGKPIIERVHSDFRKRVKERVTQLLNHQTEKAPLIEEKFIKFDGTVFDVEVTANQFQYKGKDAVQVITRDITERKKAEKENTLLAQTLKSAKDFISVTDMQDKTLFVNDAFLNTYGYTEEELIGKNITIVRSPIEQANYTDEVLSETRKGEWHGELINRRKDGSDFPIELWTSLVKDKMGKPIALVGISRDITERRQSEMALQEEKEYYREFVESLDDWVWELDLKGNHTFSNSAVEKILGYKVDEVIGTNSTDLWLEKEKSPRNIEWLNNMLNTGKGWKNYETVFKHKNGSAVWTETTGIPIFDSNNKLIGYRGIDRDITERKKTSEKLKESEKRLALTLESAELGLWDQNLVTDEIIRNERWAEMLGYTLEELEPNLKSWKDLVHPDDLQRVNSAIKEHEEGKTRSYKIEHRMKAKNGEWKWILDWGRIVEHDNYGKALRAVGTHLDITEMKKVEEELRKYSENQAILVREINHRVRNNLSAIIGMLYAEEDLARTKGTEECLPILRKLETRIKGLATAHTMLSEGEWQPLRVTQLCDNVINATIKSQYSSKTVNIAITPSEIYVDSNQAHHLAMVINELATNSLKYAVQNKEKVNISINAGKDGEKIIIQFHDDGPGYPIEMLKGDFSKTSTGFELINGIVKKSLFGEVELSNDNGALTKIIFKNFEEKNKSES